MRFPRKIPSVITCLLAIFSGCDLGVVTNLGDATHQPPDGDGPPVIAPDGGQPGDARGADARVTDRSQGPPPCVKDCVQQIWIPPGTFKMGSDGVPCEGKPRRTVTLTKGFWMDTYEVSEVNYKRCMADGACTKPIKSFKGDNRAVAGVSWGNAKAYCAWTGKRLPTEAEWEHAACGDGERCYPWSAGKDCKETPNCSTACMLGCCNDPTEINAFEGKNVSAYGLVNMGGNVYEWTADPWTTDGSWCASPCVDPSPAVSHEKHVIKGGSWISEEVFERCAARACGGEGSSKCNTCAGNIDFGIWETGIRCVSSG